jgi:SAM-dependent methyltransferase
MNEVQYLHGTHEVEQRRLAALNRLTNPSFLNFLQLHGAQSILEVGSGLGILTREVALRCPLAEVVGVEFSAAQLARAQAGMPNLRFVQGDAHDLQFANDSFDVVYCRWVLEHVADPARVLQQMRRVARPGGRVFVEENDIGVEFHDPPTPAFSELWGKVVLLQHKLGGDGLIGRKLFRLCKQAGLRELVPSMGPEVHCSGSPGFHLWVDNLATILRGCSADLLRCNIATQADVDQAIADLLAFRNRDDAAAWFYWNRIVGAK